MTIKTIENRLKKFEGYVWKNGWIESKNYDSKLETKVFLTTCKQDINSLLTVANAATRLMNDLDFIDNIDASHSGEVAIKELFFALQDLSKRG